MDLRFFILQKEVNLMNTSSKMSDMPVKKLMISMGLPMIISMVLQAVYNIVDSAFVGRIKNVGEEALNALTLAFPIQMLIVAIAIGTGVGMGAVVSMQLGQKNKTQANRTAGNALFLALIIFIAFLLFGLFGVKAYISSQTSNHVIKQMSVSYLKICCVFSFGIVFFPYLKNCFNQPANQFTQP